MVVVYAVRIGLSALAILLASGIAVGMALWFATLVAALFFRKRRIPGSVAHDALPPVTILKPVCGLEKNLVENLRTACEQDYPNYQVVYCTQRSDDPAISVLREIEREFGPERVTVVVSNVQIGANGKIN